MSRAIYPVMYCVEYPSGRVDNRVCAKNWDAIKDELCKAKTSGAVKDFRFTTEIDRRNRGLVVTSHGVIPVRRAATKRPAQIKRRAYRRYS